VHPLEGRSQARCRHGALREGKPHAVNAPASLEWERKGDEMKAD
jgi:hypothetical protein